MAALRSVTALFLVLKGANSWSRAPPRRASLTRLQAFGALARKAKEAEAAKLRQTVEADEASPIGAALKAAAAGTLEKRSDFGVVAASLTKSKGTLAVLCEYHRKCPAVLRANGVEEYEIPDIGFVSKEVRNAGASVLALNADARTGGCTDSDFVTARREQDTARADYPGPCPLVFCDTVVDEVQVARAFSLGAQAITLQLETVGAEKCGALRRCAEDRYGLEALVVCHAKDDPAALEALLQEAVGEAVGAKIVVVAGVDADGAIAALAHVPKDQGVVTVGRILTRDDKGLDEAEDAWRLRDAGYNAVWASDVLYKFGSFSGTLFSGSPDSITSVIKAMKSKASTKYARASGAFSGKGEGAKEYLGDILM